MQQRCCVPLCKNTSKVLHCLPANPDVREEWKRRIGAARFVKCNDTNYDNFRVCSDHFADCCYWANKKLRKFSAPTLNLPAYRPMDVKGSSVYIPKRKIPLDEALPASVHSCRDSTFSMVPFSPSTTGNASALSDAFHKLSSLSCRPTPVTEATTKDDPSLHPPLSVHPLAADEVPSNDNSTDSLISGPPSRDESSTPSYQVPVDVMAPAPPTADNAVTSLNDTSVELLVPVLPTTGDDPSPSISCVSSIDRSTSPLIGSGSTLFNTFCLCSSEHCSGGANISTNNTHAPSSNYVLPITGCGSSCDGPHLQPSQPYQYLPGYYMPINGTYTHPSMAPLSGAQVNILPGSDVTPSASSPFLNFPNPVLSTAAVNPCEPPDVSLMELPVAVNPQDQPFLNILPTPDKSFDNSIDSTLVQNGVSPNIYYRTVSCVIPSPPVAIQQPQQLTVPPVIIYVLNPTLENQPSFYPG